MRTRFHHIQVNVSDLRRSDAFYHGFLSWLGYRRTLSIDGSGGDMVAWSGEGNTLYLKQTGKQFVRGKFHRKRLGLNHLAFWAASKSAVDRFYQDYLRKNKVRVLYGGPKEWWKGWYSVYFEDPDKIKLEVVWTPR